jgi:hypothetical protein
MSRPTRRAALLMGAALALWGVGPAIAQDRHGWFLSGINQTDYIFHTGEGGSGRNSQRMSDANEMRSRIFENSVLFPPPEGLQAVSIRSKPNVRPGGMGALSRTVPARRFLGKRVRLSADLRTERAGRVQMWMKVNGAADRVLAFDDMQSRPLRGSTRWRRYSIVLQVPANATEITYGFLLAGSGTAWAKDFALNPTPATTPLTGGAGGSTP